MRRDHATSRSAVVVNFAALDTTKTRPIGSSFQDSIRNDRGLKALPWALFRMPLWGISNPTAGNWELPHLRVNPVHGSNWLLGIGNLVQVQNHQAERVQRALIGIVLRIVHQKGFRWEPWRLDEQLLHTQSRTPRSNP